MSDITERLEARLGSEKGEGSTSSRLNGFSLEDDLREALAEIRRLRAGPAVKAPSPRPVHAGGGDA